MAFFCCCTSGTSVLDAGHASEFREPASDHVAGALHASASPNFPSGVGGNTNTSWVGVKRPPDSATVATSEDPSLSGLLSSKKEVEKARLQELVRGFSKQAVNGIPVELIDPETAQIGQYLFSMDKYLYKLKLRSMQGDGSDSSSGTHDKTFALNNIINMNKGNDITTRAPALAMYANNVLLMELSYEEDCIIYFHFKDVMARDRFYTCVKILCMSVDINDKKQ